MSIEPSILLTIIAMVLTGIGTYVTNRISNAKFQATTETVLKDQGEEIQKLRTDLAHVQGFNLALDPNLSDKVGSMQQEVSGLKVIAESIGPLKLEISELSKMIHTLYGAYMKEEQKISKG